MQKAIEYSRKDEWTMGPGQCHKCCGNSARWLGLYGYPTMNYLWHVPGCELGETLESRGETVLWATIYWADAHSLRILEEQRRLPEAVPEDIKSIYYGYIKHPHRDGVCLPGKGFNCQM